MRIDRGRLAIVLFLTSFLVCEAGRATAADWPGFRGPRGNGTIDEAGVPTEWSDSKNLKWKLKLPGKGFSSPIVVGGRVFVTAWSGTGDQTRRHLVCVDRETGKPLWTRTVEGVSDGQESGFAYHGNASHTPVSDGERVYVMLGSSGVHAFDLEGNELWKQNVGDQQLARFGTASSPILQGNHLIVTAGAESETLRAFDKKTGKEVWKTEAASLSGTYSTPLVVTNSEDEEELVLSVTGEVWGINPVNGKLRWYAETSVDTAACPSVIAEDGVVYVIGGRGGGRTAVRTGGKNDVTESHVLWSKSGGSYVPSPILHEGRLYWINDRGIANCVDAKTGEEIAQKRVGGRYYASIVLIQDKLYAVSRFDGVRVLEATPEFEQIAHNKLSDESDFSGSPAVSDGQLFIRSDEALYCIATEK